MVGEWVVKGIRRENLLFIMKEIVNRKISALKIIILAAKKFNPSSCYSKQIQKSVVMYLFYAIFAVR